MTTTTTTETRVAAMERAVGATLPYYIPFRQARGLILIDPTTSTAISNFGSGDYLGLSGDRRIRRAAHRAIDQYGTTGSGSPILCGKRRIHVALEELLAQTFGTEAAILLPTGYAANEAALQTLVVANAKLVMDKQNHASLWAGANAARGQQWHPERVPVLIRCRHNQTDEFVRALNHEPREVPTVVAVDSLYSMTGDLAALYTLLAACRAANARFVVDEAHALGVLGGGRGALAAEGLAGEDIIITAAFSKALVSQGGVVAGSHAIIEQIAYSSPPALFSAALSPANTAAALAALRIALREPERATRALATATQVRRGLSALGYRLIPAQSPIIYVDLGVSEALAFIACRLLLSYGILVNPVVAPAVPEGKAGLRVTISAGHTPRQIQQLLAAMERVAPSLGVAPGGAA
jgi:8-amino-7-oxononanoate synthase